MDEMRNQLSRRSFLTGVGAVGAGAAAGIGARAGIASAAPLGVAPAQEIANQELEVRDMPAPEQVEYETDILVVGSGFAGIPAAVAAKQAGQRVLLVDKGYPAYSGASPFPQCYQFFDEQYGDDRQVQRDFTMQGGEYIANLDWYEVYMDESAEAYEQCVEWGVINKYPKASETGHYEAKDEYGYFRENLQNERRGKWLKVLEDNDIEFVAHTMITDVIEQDGKAVGAMGLYVPSGTVMTFHAKAIILCMGGGAYCNNGWPVSGNSFDAEWIAYQLGLPVAGKDIEHLAATSSAAPASAWYQYSWGYIENMHATAGMSVYDATPEETVRSKFNSLLNAIANSSTGIVPIDADTVSKQPTNASNSTNEADPRRTGNDVDDMPKRDIPCAIMGMGILKGNGIFCGIDDLVGYTGLPGLYAAGDCMASMTFGANYTPGQGGSVPISQIQGKRAALAASEYAAGIELERISDENVAAKSQELLAPLGREKGFDPHWARDVLVSIMAPNWVRVVKTEETLSAALVQVEYLRDAILPNLIARNSHDLRLVHECWHRTLSAEMKLRSCLERKESRGQTYRADYPYRDDENFLCYITASKGEDGTMQIGRVPVKDEWKGDLGQDYVERYIVRYPGEAEALGLTVE